MKGLTLFGILSLGTGLLCGMISCSSYNEEKEFSIEEIQDRERVLSFFWNDCEITEDQLHAIYDNRKARERFVQLRETSQNGDIVGYRKYKYGNLVKERQYTISKKDEKYGGQITFNESTDWAINSDAPIIAIFTFLYYNYYLENKEEAKKYFTGL